MPQLSRTWWGQKFIQALESFTDSGRLQRGRSYSGPSRILKFDIFDGRVTATVRGNVNPYFGVYKEPKYIVDLILTPISSKDWPKIIQNLSSKASLVAKLLLNEMPDTIESSFQAVHQRFLPSSQADIKSSCSCPDWVRPCKHIAGVYYRLAQDLDRDPFLLFELRGLSREELHAELSKSPLGQALAAEIVAESDLPLEPSESLYRRSQRVPLNEDMSLKEFWQGSKRLPQTMEEVNPATVSAIVVKKQGDFPPFWHKDASFIAVMEEVYERVKTKNKDLL
jgi:uncharacterized Zn finger protein